MTDWTVIKWFVSGLVLGVVLADLWPTILYVIGVGALVVAVMAAAWLAAGGE